MLNGIDDQGSAVKAFAVYDSKAGAYMNPFFLPTVAMAIRSMTKAALDDGHDFHLYGGDYTLMEIGTWDPTSGVLEKLDAPIAHGTALQHRSSYELRTITPSPEEATA